MQQDVARRQWVRHRALCPLCEAGLPCAFAEGLRATAEGREHGRPAPAATLYVGRRLTVRLPDGRGQVVHEVRIVGGGALPPRLDLAAWSPRDWDWGREGPGARQLALGLLAHVLGDDARALARCRAFATEVVARLPADGWRLGAGQLRYVLGEAVGEPWPVQDLSGEPVGAERPGPGKRRPQVVLQVLPGGKGLDEVPREAVPSDPSEDG